MQSLSLVHLTRQPLVKSHNPPLLLQLHGIGSNEQDLFGLNPPPDPRFLILSLRAPYTLAPGCYAWFAVDFTPQGSIINYPQAEASRETLIAFIDEAVTAYAANPEQVYLMGFSQGAIMSASIALSRPDLIAGAALMSGRIPPEMYPTIATPAQLTGLPILVTHGTEDTILPINHGRASRDLLSSLPVALTYHEYQMDHGINRQNLNDVNAWLSNQLDRKNFNNQNHQ
jgi:phospholipase/carboxylesterase